MNDSKTIDDLRERLFAAIDAVKAGTMTIDQARTISDLSQVIVNTARVEVEYLRANGGGESMFVSASGNRNLPPGITGIHRHRLEG